MADVSTPVASDADYDAYLHDFAVAPPEEKTGLGDILFKSIQENKPYVPRYPATTPTTTPTTPTTNEPQVVFDPKGSYGTPAPLLDQLSQVESGGNATAINKDSGATGAYQFMPDTVDMLKKQGVVFDPKDPVASRAAADYYLQQLVKQHGGDYNAALKDYGGFKTKDPSQYVAQVTKNGELLPFNESELQPTGAPFNDSEAQIINAGRGNVNPPLIGQPQPGEPSTMADRFNATVDAAKMVAKNVGPGVIPAVNAGIRGVSAGIIDPAAAALQYGVQHAAQAVGLTDNVPTFQEILAKNRAAQVSEEQAHPVASTIGNIAGSVYGFGKMAGAAPKALMNIPALGKYAGVPGMAVVGGTQGGIESGINAATDSIINAPEGQSTWDTTKNASEAFGKSAAKTGSIVGGLTAALGVGGTWANEKIVKQGGKWLSDQIDTLMREKPAGWKETLNKIVQPIRDADAAEKAGVNATKSPPTTPPPVGPTGGIENVEPMLADISAMPMAARNDMATMNALAQKHGFKDYHDFAVANQDAASARAASVPIDKDAADLESGKIFSILAKPRSSLEETEAAIMDPANKGNLDETLKKHGWDSFDQYYKASKEREIANKAAIESMAANRSRPMSMEEVHNSEEWNNATLEEQQEMDRLYGGIRRTPFNELYEKAEAENYFRAGYDNPRGFYHPSSPTANPIPHQTWHETLPGPIKGSGWTKEEFATELAKVESAKEGLTDAQLARAAVDPGYMDYIQRKSNTWYSGKSGGEVSHIKAGIENLAGNPPKINTTTPEWQLWEQQQRELINAMTTKRALTAKMAMPKAGPTHGPNWDPTDLQNQLRIVRSYASTQPNKGTKEYQKVQEILNDPRFASIKDLSPTPTHSWDMPKQFTQIPNTMGMAGTPTPASLPPGIENKSDKQLAKLFSKNLREVPVNVLPGGMAASHKIAAESLTGQAIKTTLSGLGSAAAGAATDYAFDYGKFKLGLGNEPSLKSSLLSPLTGVSGLYGLTRRSGPLLGSAAAKYASSALSTGEKNIIPKAVVAGRAGAESVVRNQERPAPFDEKELQPAPVSRETFQKLKANRPFDENELVPVK